MPKFPSLQPVIVILTEYWLLQKVPSLDRALALLDEAESSSTFPHSDKNKKSQSLTSINFCLEALNARITADESDHASFFVRGRARKYRLSLMQPCSDYDDLVLEYLSDFVQAAQLDPKNDEYIGRLAGEKLEYTLDLERHVLSLGESIEGEGLVSKSLALSWSHTLEIARSALQITNLRPENRLLALSALCHSLYATKQYSECDKMLLAWIEACGEKENLANAMELKGRLLDTWKKDASGALKVWCACLSKFPDHIPTLHQKATILRTLRRSAEAIEVWKKLVDLRPNSADFWYRSAADHEICGDKTSAIAALTRALELSPKHLFALNDLAFHHITDANWADALPLLQEVLCQGPNDDIPWINIANVLYHLKDYTQALRSINNAFSAKRVGNRPPSAEEWLIKVAILRALSAIPLERSESADTPSSSTSATSSEESINQPTTEEDKYDRAAAEIEIIKCFVQSMKAVDKLEQAQAFFEYADYLVEKGDVEQARSKLAHALAMRPGATIAMLNLTRLELQSGTESLFRDLQSRK